MPLSKENFQFAIDDARRRQAAIVELIAAIDRQALGLLQLYVTLAGASLSGAGFILLSAQPILPTAPSTGYPKSLGVALLAFAALIIVGTVLCLKTIWPAKISLPGRNPDFWEWSSRAEVTDEKVLQAYMEDLGGRVVKNTTLNYQMSRSMKWAKIFGILAPIAGLVAGIAHYRMS